MYFQYSIQREVFLPRIFCLMDPLLLKFSWIDAVPLLFAPLIEFNFPLRYSVCGGVEPSTGTQAGSHESKNSIYTSSIDRLDLPVCARAGAIAERPTGIRLRGR